QCKTSGGQRRHRKSSLSLIEIICITFTMQSNLSTAPQTTASLPLKPPKSPKRVLKDQISVLERWAEHFNTLLNQDSEADHTILDQLPELPPIDNLNQPLTFLEVLSAVRSLQ